MTEESPNSLNVDADDIIEELGFGPAQFITFVFVIIAMSVNNMDTTAHVFTTRNAGYRCHVPECDSMPPTFNASWLGATVPYDGIHRARCERYEYLKSSNNVIDEDICNTDHFNRNKTMPCENWVNIEDNSIVTEFNIQCQDWKHLLVGTINGVGQFVCLMYFGYFADRFGAKFMLSYATLACVIVRLVQSCVSNYWIFLFLEFLSPLLATGNYGAAYVLGAELATPKQRVLSTTMIIMFSNLGMPTLGLIAWRYPYWRTVLRLCYGPALVLLLCPMIALDSFRWMLVKGRHKDVLNLINRSEKWKCSKKPSNRLKIICTYFKTSQSRKQIDNNNQSIECSIFDILKSLKLCMRILLCTYCWIVCTLVVFGMNFNAVSLSGNENFNFILSSFVDCPTVLIYLIILKFTGRKKGQCGAFAFSALFCISFAFLAMKNESSLSLILYLCAKSCISLAFDMVYIFTAEIFPTTMRNSCLMFCSMVGRLGTIIAPQLLILVGSSSALMMVFGGATALAAVITLWLPDTTDIFLPDTVHEAVNVELKVKV